MIRPATHADLPQLLAWAEEFSAYHPLIRIFPRAADAVEAALAKMITSDAGVVLMHEFGAIGGYVAPLWTNPDVLVATESFWWATRDGLPLMRAFEQWAVTKEATLVQMTAILGVEQDVTRLYDTRGYAACEMSFVKAAR